MGEGAIVIREARDEDREAIRDVLLSAYGQYEAMFPAERWQQYKDDIVASVTKEGPKARLVAEWDGRVAGTVLLFESSLAAYGTDIGIDTPIIRLLAVKPEARGRGIGAALLREGARLAAAWGAKTLHLHTSDKMASAVRLYERLGFERAYDKEFYDGEHLVKSYRLDLKQAARLQTHR